MDIAVEVFLVDVLRALPGELDVVSGGHQE
jgi:hypothetical protein